MVLKPRLNRTVQLGKPRISHFYGLFNMKNRSMQKKQWTVQIAVRLPGSVNCDWFRWFTRVLCFKP